MATASLTLPLTVNPAGPPPTRRLLGGWRLPQAFARGGIAIDFATGRLWMTGHMQTADVLLYQLPAIGTGTDINQWPIVPIAQVIPTWWGGSGGYFANDLIWWQGKVWAALLVTYDQNPVPVTTFVAQDGETFTVPIIRSQGAGFWKRGPGLDPLFGGGGGGGGSKSDKGVSMGPVLCEWDGTVRIQYQWPQYPGANLENWNQRAPRPANYYPTDVRNGTAHVDTWWAWEPRNGEGRWASDVLFGGGLLLPEGYVCWPWMGTGPIDYNNQSWTFAPDAMNRTYQYTYDRDNYQFLRWEGDGTDPLPVTGRDLDESGWVYLAKGNAWSSNGMPQYTVDVAVHVYG